MLILVNYTFGLFPHILRQFMRPLSPLERHSYNLILNAILHCNNHIRSNAIYMKMLSYFIICDNLLIIIKNIIQIIIFIDL